jgi:hypothetical protein
VCGWYRRFRKDVFLDRTTERSVSAIPSAAGYRGELSVVGRLALARMSRESPVNYLLQLFV